MAWIEYHTALRDHWKIQRLADELSVPYTQALGAVSCLWLWCAEYAPTGFLGRFTDDEIRLGARVTDKKFTFSLLLSCGLTTKSKFINDWGKHGIKLLESKRKANREYAKRKRKSGYPLDTDSVAIPNQPYHTIPNQPNHNSSMPPTIEEVINYCQERKNGVDHHKWFNHYQAKGWLIGKSKMKDWKAAVRTWEQTGRSLLIPKKKPVRLQVLEMIALKIDKQEIKSSLMADGYSEVEIDEALGKEF